MQVNPAHQLLMALLVAAFFVSVPALAESDQSRIDALEEKMSAMAAELEALQVELDAVRSEDTANQIETLQVQVQAAQETAQRAEQSADDWMESTAVSHISGYASVDFVDPEASNSAFSADFNPIFHFLYGERLLWESELEIGVGEDGETETELEYSTLDIFINDYLTLVAGKFLSPVGYFRQNLHPAWINKLPSAPPGFGHDGAAPTADVGVELRGAIPLDDQRYFTYAGYVGNGPVLEAEDGELEGVDSDGFSSDADGNKVVGGRIAILPVPRLEIGLSGAFGDIAVTEDDGMEIEGDPERDYRVFGADISYQSNDLYFRSEYIRQKVGAQAGSVAPESATWETWYAQGAYVFGQAKWEGVVRYADFNSPHANQSQEQWAIGLNYLLTPNALIKFGYEFNDGLAGEITDDDVFLAQMAYGY